MSDAYKCDGCTELKEGKPFKRVTVHPFEDGERDLRDYCEDCWTDREYANNA